MSLQRLRAKRNLAVARYGSPNYLHLFGVLAAGANEYVEMATTFPASAKYAPLTSLTITNRSGEFLDLQINGQDFGQVPAGVIYEVSDTAIWSFRLTNNDATATLATEVRANIQKPPLGANELARMTAAGLTLSDLLGSG